MNKDILLRIKTRLEQALVVMENDPFINLSPGELGEMNDNQHTQYLEDQKALKNLKEEIEALNNELK